MLHVNEQELQVMQVCIHESQVIASHVGLQVVPQVAIHVSQVNPHEQPQVYPHVDEHVLQVEHVALQVSPVK